MLHHREHYERHPTLKSNDQRPTCIDIRTHQDVGGGQRPHACLVGRTTLHERALSQTRTKECCRTHTDEQQEGERPEAGNAAMGGQTGG